MPKQKRQTNQVVSAQVIVRSKSGRKVQGDIPITSANVAQYTPSPEDVADVQKGFRDAGFDVGNMVGISFAISAPLSQFERFFGTKLRIGRGEVALQGQDAPSGGLELPLKRIPPDLATRTTAVVFTPPADLHGKRESALF